MSVQLGIRHSIIPENVNLAKTLTTLKIILTLARNVHLTQNIANKTKFMFNSKFNFYTTNFIILLNKNKYLEDIGGLAS
jgi:hypothetical protein